MKSRKYESNIKQIDAYYVIIASIYFTCAKFFKLLTM
jgi:hypothetical protein